MGKDPSPGASLSQKVKEKQRKKKRKSKKDQSEQWPLSQMWHCNRKIDPLAPRLPILRWPRTQLRRDRVACHSCDFLFANVAISDARIPTARRGHTPRTHAAQARRCTRAQLAPRLLAGDARHLRRCATLGRALAGPTGEPSLCFFFFFYARF